MGAISSIYKGRGVRGALNYVFAEGKGLGGGIPDIIDRWDIGGMTPREISADFRDYRELAGPGKDVFNIAFSWRPEEMPSAEVRAAYIADWFAHMGMSDCPRIVVEHHDAAHINDHAVGLYLDKQGNRIHQGWDFTRQNKVCTVLDEKYGLRAENRTRKNNPAPSPALSVVEVPEIPVDRPEMAAGSLDTARIYFAAALDRTKTRGASWDALAHELQVAGYTLTVTKKQPSNVIQGIGITAADGTYFAGSKMDRTWSYQQLIKKHGLAGDPNVATADAGAERVERVEIDPTTPTDQPGPVPNAELPEEYKRIAGLLDKTRKQRPNLSHKPGHRIQKKSQWYDLEKYSRNMDWVCGWSTQPRHECVATTFAVPARVNWGIMGGRVPSMGGQSSSTTRSQARRGLALEVGDVGAQQPQGTTTHSTVCDSLPRYPALDRGANVAHTTSRPRTQPSLFTSDNSFTGTGKPIHERTVTPESSRSADGIRAALSRVLPPHDGNAAMAAAICAPTGGSMDSLASVDGLMGFKWEGEPEPKGWTPEIPPSRSTTSPAKCPESPSVPSSKLPGHR